MRGVVSDRWFGGVERLLFSPQIVYGKGLALIKNKFKKKFANKIEIHREQFLISSRTIFDFFANNFGKVFE